jgi:pyruvate dehydrogenase E1 component alpha subunit
MKYDIDLLIGLYRTMVRIRLCEESFVEPILRKKIGCPVHLYCGEEAIAAGVCANLTDKDAVFGTHRSHGHFLAKGGSMNELVAEVYCKEGGCSKGRGGSMHLIDPSIGFLGSAPIVGGTIALALGAALASNIREDGAVSVAFFGDGAAGEGVLYEAMNFSSIHKLPMLFVCENNLYSTHMPILEIRSRKTIHETASPFDLLTAEVDGNDVLRMYQKSKELIDHCRQGHGPAFLECSTYRYRGHVGPDDNVQGTHTDIRPLDEIEVWKNRDPITRLRKYVLDNSVSAETELDAIDIAIHQEVQSAHDAAINGRDPMPEELHKYVFN